MLAAAMEARFVAAQRALICLLVVTLGVLGICRPRPGDAQIARAHAELAAFTRAADLALIAGTRRAQAMQFAQVSLQELRPSADASQARAGRAAKGQPRWRIAESAGGLLPLVTLELASLADVSVQSRGPAEAQVGIPDLQAAQAALAFRLSRLALEGVPVLRGAVLEAAELSADDVAREQEAQQVQGEVAQARAQLERAERKLEFAQKRVDARKKRRSRSLDKFQELLATASAQRDEKAAALERAASRFEELAQEVVRVSASAAVRPQALREIPAQARLRIELEAPDGSARQIALAVALQRRQVTLPPLVIPGVDGTFPALSSSGVWEELAPLAPAPALRVLEQRLSWPSRSLELEGFSVRGAWLLQLCPLLCALALAWARARVERAASSHRLFGAQPPGALPRVGFDKRFQELCVVVLLPLAACVSAAVALWLLAELPVLPAIAFTVCAPLSLRVFAKLDELRVLNRSIVQYHSYPPPALALGERDLEGGPARA